MFLVLEHPLVAFRDCEHCQKWHYDERTGEVMTTATGDPIPRDADIPPPCRNELGCPKGTPEESQALTPQNWLAYQHFQRCRATGNFPDDSIVEANAAIIDDCERTVARGNAKLTTELLRLWLTKDLST